MVDSAARPSLRRIVIARHPVYSMLLPVPIVCFLGVVLTDATYIASDGNLIWLAVSSWLLLFGLAFGVLASIVVLIDFVRSPTMRAFPGWAHVLLFGAALLVELFNIFIHERDGWTAVVPIGLTLSIVGAVLMLIAGWLYRPTVEAAP